MTATPFRYVGVAGVCVLLHNAVMIAGDRAGLHYMVAALLSFLIVSLTGFVLHARLTFAAPLSLAGYGRYAAAMALNLPMSVALLWLIYRQAGLAMTMAAPLASTVMLIWNYIASRWALLTVAPERTCP